MPRGTLPVAQREGEDRPLAVGQVAPREVVRRARRESRVVDREHLGTSSEPLGHLERDGALPCHAQRERLDPLRDEERRERRRCRPEPRRHDLARVGDAGAPPEALDVAGTAESSPLHEVREQRARPSGVERPGVDHDPAEHRALPGEELARRVHDDVRPVLDRAQQVRGGERVVDDQRQPVSVRDARDGGEVDQVVAGVGNRLAEQHARVGRDPPGPLVGVVGVLDEVGLDPQSGQVLQEQPARPLVDARRGQDALPRGDEGEHRHRDRRLPARHEQRLRASLEVRHLAFGGVRRRVAVAGVRVPLARAEVRPRLLEVVEPEPRREEDGRRARAHAAGTARGVARVDLARGETPRGAGADHGGRHLGADRQHGRPLGVAGRGDTVRSVAPDATPEPRPSHRTRRCERLARRLRAGAA